MPQLHTSTSRKKTAANFLRKSELVNSVLKVAAKTEMIIVDIALNGGYMENKCAYGGGNGQKIVLLPLLGYWYYVAFVQLVLYPYIIGALEASVGVH